MQQMITLIGGIITADSAENVGIKMKIMFPLLTGDSTQEQFESLAQSLDLIGKQILLVDDDPVGIKYLGTILNYFGASFTCYVGALSFRNDLKNAQYDLAILDIQMY
jgi:PleD family two-component response regulator